MKVKENIANIILILHDFLISLLILYLSLYVKGFLGDINFFIIKPNPPYFLKFFKQIWWSSIFLVVIFSIKRLYHRRLPLWLEAKEIISGAFFTVLLSFSFIFLKKMGNYPRSILFFYFLLISMILPFTRYLLKILLTKLNLYRKNIIIIGAGNAGKTVAKALIEDKELGFYIRGFLDDFKDKSIIINSKEFPILGRIEDFHKIHQKENIDSVVIAIPSLDRKKLSKITAEIQKYVRQLYIVPEMKGIALFNTELYHLFEEQLFLLQINNNLKLPRNRFIKRCFDLTFAIILMPIILPVIAIIGIMIKLDSKGPVFFIQERFGQYNKRFKCIKFRTMYNDSDKILFKYLETNPEAKKEWEKYKKLKGYDPRVTKMGKFLRKTSLDELPQIFNIILGDMSFVGPRPYMPREEKDMGEYKEYILLTKPGITGLWQVSGRNELTFKDRLKIDTWYVLNWSLWLDIVILIKTVKVVLRNEGAY